MTRPNGWSKAIASLRPASSLRPGLLPAARQDAAGIDDTGHRVGLGQVAPKLAGCGMDVLRQQAEAVAARQHVNEELSRLRSASERGERVDVPELANEEGGLGQAEVVLGGVAHDEAVAPELLADDRAGAHEPLVAGRQQAEVGQKQHAGDEL